MKWVPMGIGHPGQKLGGAHVAKHYLCPEEVWDDLAEGVDRSLRPRKLLSDPFEWRWPWDENNDALTDSGVRHFDTLGVAFEKAYLPIVERRVEHHMEQGWWHSDRPNIYIAPVGQGLVVEVYVEETVVRMRTAYRRVGAKVEPAVDVPFSGRNAAFRGRAERHVARRNVVADGDDR